MPTAQMNQEIDEAVRSAEGALPRSVARIGVLRSGF
jgi:hypothetical protein